LEKETMLSKTALNENTNKLREARHELLREKRRAKRKWQYEYAEKAKRETLFLTQKKPGAWCLN
jgi:hypothetical protein